MNIVSIILTLVVVALSVLLVVIISKRPANSANEAQAEADRAAAEERYKRFEEMQRMYMDDARRNAEYQMQQMQRLEQQHQTQIQHLEQQHREHIERLERENRAQAERFAEAQAEQKRTAQLEFEALSRETLRLQSEAMERYNSDQLKGLLDPMRERLEAFNKAVSEAYIKDNADRRSLQDQIERLMNFNNRIGEEANNLAKALKGDNKVQGEWGETVLETLLEQAGLQKGINFETQVTTDDTGRTLRDEDGKHIRPDVIVALPEGRRIIIDSKVSLTSYLDLVAADDKPAIDAAKARLVESVKGHIQELAGGKYQKEVKNSAEHILMFMPNEGAYIAAVQAEPKLWDYAFSRGVVIVAPTHLFSVMQLISQLWRQDGQNRNAAEIAKLGGLIYDKVATFLNDFEGIAKHLQAADNAYEKCRKHLTSGGTSIVARADRMRTLGAKASKAISQAMLDSADLNSDLELDDKQIEP